MNFKGVGAVLCLMASILMSAKYIAAAVFMSNVSSWSSDLFKGGLSNVGAPLTIAAVASLIAGIVFLGYGIVKDSDRTRK